MIFTALGPGVEDHIAIQRTFSQLGEYMGAGDATGYASLFETAEGIIVAPGRPPITHVQIEDALRSSLSRFAVVQYLITGVLSSAEGDVATSTAQVLAVHLIDDQIDHGWQFGGRFETTHQRIDGAWSFASLTLIHLWQVGSPPQVAA